MLVDLAAFENVRTAAGQLSAERVVADSRARLESLLRTGDALVQLSEDRFGVVVAVRDQEQLDTVCARIHSVLVEVPVPRRALQVRPRVRSALGAAALAHPDFAGLMQRVRDAAERRAAG